MRTFIDAMFFTCLGLLFFILGGLFFTRLQADERRLDAIQAREEIDAKMLQTLQQVVLGGPQ